MMTPMISALLALFISVSHAEFNLSQGLTQSQRELVLKTLGLGTLSKNLFTPQPLGTEGGLELAFMTEMISTKEIENFVDNSQSDDTLFYPKLIIGKGLFSRTDIFVHFIPYTATLGLSEFGGMLRYNLLGSETSKLLGSIIVHANSANFNNQLTSRNIGADITVGTNTKTVAGFLGLGWASSAGRFVGGALGTTDTLRDEVERINSMHYSVGALYRYRGFNFSLSYDLYEEAVYTAKIGFLL